MPRPKWQRNSYILQASSEQPKQSQVKLLEERELAIVLACIELYCVPKRRQH